MWTCRLQATRPALLRGVEECMHMLMTIISILYQITGEDPVYNSKSASPSSESSLSELMKISVLFFSI